MVTPKTTYGVIEDSLWCNAQGAVHDKVTLALLRFQGLVGSHTP